MLNATPPPGGGVTRRYSAEIAGFDGQGSRQKIAEYDVLALITSAKDTDCATALGALGSGDGGKQIEAARAPMALIVTKASPAAKTTNFSFIYSATFKALDATKADETLVELSEQFTWRHECAAPGAVGMYFRRMGATIDCYCQALNEQAVTTLLGRATLP